MLFTPRLVVCKRLVGRSGKYGLLWTRSTISNVCCFWAVLTLTFAVHTLWAPSRQIERFPLRWSPDFASMLMAATVQGAEKTWVHVAREFSPLVEYGGVGYVTGSVVYETLRTSPTTLVAIIIPAYQFLEFIKEPNVLPPERGTISTVTESFYFFEHGKRRKTSVTCTSHKYYNTPDLNGRAAVVCALHAPLSGRLQSLWSSANSSEAIYTTPYGVSFSERDAYFSFAASVVAAHICSVAGTPDSCAVQSHGATNALIPWFMKQLLPVQLLPTLSYTLHDYLGEVWQHFRVEELFRFAPLSSQPEKAFVTLFQRSKDSAVVKMQKAELHKLFPNDQVYASAIATMHAKIITGVSMGMLTGIIDGIFPCPVVVSEILAAAAAEGRVVAVPNAAPGNMHPFLRSNILGEATYADGNSILHRKLEAKAKLCHWKVITSEETCSVINMAASDAGIALFMPRQKQKVSFLWSSRPLVWLFVGRFESNKGVRHIPALVEAACGRRLLKNIVRDQDGSAPYDAQSIHIIVMGLKSGSVDPEADAAIELLVALQDKCPVTVISDKKKQARWGMYIRLAADVVVVPSDAESYGIVAAEALAHAAIPVVNGVGGLGDVVRPRRDWLQLAAKAEGLTLSCFSRIEFRRPAKKCSCQDSESPGWTGYVVPALPECKGDTTLLTLIAAASASYALRCTLQDGTERFLESLVHAAPRWDGEFGPVKQYLQLLYSTRVNNQVNNMSDAERA